MVAVQITRQQVADVLRKAGLPELANEAQHVLPDPVDVEQVAAWGWRHGITMEKLTSRMGGSP